MIILHNSESKESRDKIKLWAAGIGPFVNGVAVDETNHVIVYDWYKGGREAWIAAGGTDHVSAFPSIVLNIPAYHEPERVDGQGRTWPRVDIPAHQIAIRKPESDDLTPIVNALNQKIAASRSDGGTAQNITRASMNKDADELIAKRASV